MSSNPYELTLTSRKLTVSPEPPGLYNYLGYMHNHHNGDPEWKFASQVGNNKLHTLPGFRQRILEWFARKGISPTEKIVNRPPLNLNNIDLEGQRESGEILLKGLEKQMNGIIIGPCGIGKTHIIKALVEASPTKKILITTDNVVAALQLQKDLSDLLPREKIGVWCSGKKTRPQAITVVTNDSLSSINKNKHFIQAGLTLQDFGMWIADEVHTLPTPSVLEQLPKITAPIRYGLTATLERKDGAHFLLEGYIGPTLSELTHNEGVELGDVTKIKVIIFPVPKIISCNPPSLEDYNWKIMLKGLVHYRPLHYYIRRIAEMVPPDGGHIIFADWVRYCNILKREIPNATILHGKVNPAHSNKVKNSLKTDANACVIATDIIQKAFNAPPVKYITMAALGSSTEKIQRIGRATRIYPGKTHAQVHEFLHFQHPVLFQASLLALQHYINLGWDIKIMATPESLAQLNQRHQEELGTLIKKTCILEPYLAK